MTATFDQVINSLDDESPYHTLHELDRSCNIHLDSFIKTISDYRYIYKGPTFSLLRINIMMVDFMEETNVVELSRASNRKKCNDDVQYRARTQSGNDCRSWAAKGLILLFFFTIA